MTPQSFRSSEQGFSLIEVMVAIMVLAIGIFAVGKFQTTAIDGDFKADKLTRASSIAANKAEEFLKMNWDNPELSDGVHNPPTSCLQLCLGWTVVDDVPILPISYDTNGALLSQPVSQTKSIEIVMFKHGIDVFKNSQDFGEKANKQVTLNIVKPRNL